MLGETDAVVTSKVALEAVEVILLRIPVSEVVALGDSDKETAPVPVIGFAVAPPLVRVFDPVPVTGFAVPLPLLVPVELVKMPSDNELGKGVADADSVVTSELEFVKMPLDAAVELGLPEALVSSEVVGEVKLVKMPVESKLELENSE